MRHPPQKRLFAVLFLIVFTGITIATLWPFDFFPSNGAKWIPNRNGIHFSQPGGVLISSSSLRVPASLTNNSVTIELWLRSDEIWSSRTALGVYNPSRGGPFLIRQWNGDLSVSRDPLDSPDSRIGDKIHTKRLFERGVPLFLAITSGPAGTVVYIDAAQKQSFPNFQIRAGDLSGQIVLGTAPDSFSPWRGDIYSLSLYASALSPEEIRQHYDSPSASSQLSNDSDLLLARYVFAEASGPIIHSFVSGAADLQIPKNFSVPYKPFLQSPFAHYETTWHYYRDAVLNVLGFIPYGFLLCAWLANTRFWRFAVLSSFISGAAFSFLIELIQGCVPQRDSGLNDIVTNSLGVLLGALIARRLLLHIPFSANNVPGLDSRHSAP